MLFLILLVQFALFISSLASEVCHPGTFKTSTGCSPCPRLKFSTTTNARSCRRCPPGQEGNPEKTSCVPIRCRLGWYLPSGKVNCRVCPEDSYSTTINATECTPCPPDKKSLRGATSPTECIRCPIGRAVDRSYRHGRVFCSRCTHFRSTFTVSSDKCVSCIPGTFRNKNNWLDGRCFPCHPGRYAPGHGYKHCYKCPAGTHQPAQGSSACLPCPSGSVSDGTGRFCQTICPSGSPGCVKCGAGQTYNNSTNRCETCPPGSVSPKAAITECIPCRGGSRPNAAQSHCHCDPAFFYRVADESCQECPAGTANSDGGNCNSCVLNGRSSEGCICPPLMENVNNTCVPCTPNYYNHRTCRRCERNERIDEVRGTCVPCPPDTWSDSPGARTCNPCLADTKRPVGESYCECEKHNEGVIDDKCTLCPAGKYRSYNSILQVPTCGDCFPGKFNNKPGGSCESCPHGRRPPGFGSRKCLEPCPSLQEREEIGIFVDEGECVCKDKHEPVMEGGVLTCKPCKTGEVVWNDKCVCQSGIYSGPDGSICEPCPENHYTFGNRCRCRGGWVPKNGGCEPCPAGTFEEFENCVVCPPGTITLIPGRWHCSTCPRGTNPDGPANCV